MNVSVDQTPVDKLAAQLELVRRESKSFDTGPLPNGSTIPDYSESLLRIGMSLSTLDESLPNGQGTRSAIAFRVLRRGLNDLEPWLRAKGIPIDSV